MGECGQQQLRPSGDFSAVTVTRLVRREYGSARQEQQSSNQACTAEAFTPDNGEDGASASDPPGRLDISSSVVDPDFGLGTADGGETVDSVLLLLDRERSWKRRRSSSSCIT